MSNTPEDTELRRKISKMIEGISAGYHGEDGIDYIMNLITLHTQEAERVARIDELKRTSGCPGFLLEPTIKHRIAQLTNPTEAGEK